jgi:hypothetical protein
VRKPFTSYKQEKCCKDAWLSGKTSCKLGCEGCRCKDGSNLCGCAHVENIGEGGGHGHCNQMPNSIQSSHKCSAWSYGQCSASRFGKIKCGVTTGYRCRCQSNNCWNGRKCVPRRY